MAVTILFDGTQTCVVSTEHNLTGASETTEAAPYAFFDWSNAAAGDQFQVRIYEKVLSSGSQVCIWTGEVFDAQSADDMALVLPPIPLKHGWHIR